MSKKLQILAIMPESIGGRLTSSSLFDGFRLLGHDVEVFDALFEPVDAVKSLVEEKDFDFVASYDYTAIIYKTKLGLKIPSINYFSDVIDDEHSGKYWREYYDFLNEDENYVFYWDRELCEKKKNEIKNLFYMPHFVNTMVYRNLGLRTEYELMFAGRLDSDFRLRTVVTLMKKFKHLRFGWFAHQKHFEQALLRLDSDEEKELLKKNYRGFVDTEEKMSKVINKSKIVFNYNAQGAGSLNYRTYQVMACEKLLLSDYRKEGEELFSPGENFVMFSSFDDLCLKIDYFLNNEEEYKRIVHAGREVVEKNHSSKVCAAKMFDCIL